MNLSRLFVLVGFFLLACDDLPKEEAKKKIKDGVVKQYYANKVLKTEIEYKDGKRNGTAKNYYKDGKLHQQIEYANGKKNGEAITYYENGKVYQITPYENDLIHGLRKKYRQNGKLMAEVPYNYDRPCRGLKEFLLDGSLKKQYPKLTVQPIDNVLKNGTYILRIKSSDGTSRIKFFVNTKLGVNGCLEGSEPSTSLTEPGVLEVKFNLPENTFIMEELHFVAEITTTLGNPYITHTKHNLAIENRGF
ncbi:toxin-antitoxin system YwqK family antitoxin [Fulvivirga lutimaris]|uniref:toxin-antitoxin system YwqK family antitoxin n=1 Tax=Fulvivirga lutimaris TaxID=1819566 RepID=UPI0012BCF25E|nr:toxin-antitoxin system YwqK family antitoxin [Fulvivirga lutimaris]MTI39805.1 toxin-antitoxin system YwqK family antitoxin [Fulvivirga lutimaris]